MCTDQATIISDDLTSKDPRHIVRDDGSEIWINVSSMCGPSLKQEIDVYVLCRTGPSKEWRVASTERPWNWHTMSVDDYFKHGRSEKMNLASHGEVLAAISEFNNCGQSPVDRPGVTL